MIPQDKGGDMNFNGILIGSEDPTRLTDYYRKLFGDPMYEGGGYTVWQLGGGYISIGPHSEVTGKNLQPGRFLWNIETADVRGEFDRLVAAGAIAVREPYGFEEAGPDDLIATLEDPDGNYFQLMSPMPEDGGGPA
jgi:predicted enzyme related to lactoylglutathione lyase